VRTQRWGGSRTVALIAVIGAAFVGGACSGDPDATTPTETEAPPAPPTTAAATITTAVGSTVTTKPLRPDMSADEIAVRNVLDVYAAEEARVNAQPNPEDPVLNELVTGDFKESVRRGFLDDQAKQVYYRREGGGPNAHRTENVRFEAPDAAIAVECHIDDTFTYRQGEGAPIDSAVTSYRLETKVVRGEDGRWRLTFVTLTNKVPGKNECYGLG
jgi:hypothetical protein